MRGVLNFTIFCKRRKNISLILNKQSIYCISFLATTLHNKTYRFYFVSNLHVGQVFSRKPELCCYGSTRSSLEQAKWSCGYKAFTARFEPMRHRRPTPDERRSIQELLDSTALIKKTSKRQPNTSLIQKRRVLNIYAVAEEQQASKNYYFVICYLM